jgi:cell division septation protein DedD
MVLVVKQILKNGHKKFWHFCLKNACFLLPCPDRSTRARVLKNSALFLYILVLLGFQLYIYHLSPRILGFATDIQVASLYQVTNEKRIAAGVAPLKVDSRLEQAALAKAQDMFTKDYWAHYAPDGSTSPWQFILSFGYSYEVAGENLAKDFDTSAAVVEAWLASPSHRANLLNCNYQDIGIVAVNGILLGKETTLVVQFLGTLQPVTVAQEASEPPAPTSSDVAGTTETPQEPEPEPEPVEVTGPEEEQVAISRPAALTQIEATPWEKLVNAVNPVSSPKTIPLGFGFILMGLFALDEVVMLRGGLTGEEIKRTGENLAHVSILGLLMALVWLTKTGGVL